MSRQEQLEDMFADPGPEAAERFWAVEAAASSTAGQGSSSAEVLNYDGGDAADQESDTEDVGKQMLAEGIARSVEDVHVSSHASGSSRKTRTSKAQNH
eukprot:716152-Amphidinium_carterae.1